MRSFAFVIEPAAQPRLAAALLLLHVAVAALPWLTRCPAPLALALGALTMAGFAGTLGQVPGRHCRLRAVAADTGGWRLRAAGDSGWLGARLGPQSRAFAGLVLLDVRAGRRRFGWLLTRQALPPAEFRRLKARIRLTC